MHSVLSRLAEQFFFSSYAFVLDVILKLHTPTHSQCLYVDEKHKLLVASMLVRPDLYI